MKKCAKSKPHPLQAKMHCRRLLPVLCTMAISASACIRSKRPFWAPSLETTAQSLCGHAPSNVSQSVSRQNVLPATVNQPYCTMLTHRDHAVGTRFRLQSRRGACSENSLQRDRVHHHAQNCKLELQDECANDTAARSDEKMCGRDVCL
jgi:hypothetical protein